MKVAIAAAAFEEMTLLLDLKSGTARAAVAPLRNQMLRVEGCER